MIIRALAITDHAAIIKNVLERMSHFHRCSYGVTVLDAGNASLVEFEGLPSVALNAHPGESNDGFAARLHAAEAQDRDTLLQFFRRETMQFEDAIEVTIRDKTAFTPIKHRIQLPPKAA